MIRIENTKKLLLDWVKNEPEKSIFDIIISFEDIQKINLLGNVENVKENINPIFPFFNKTKNERSADFGGREIILLKFNTILKGKINISALSLCIDKAVEKLKNEKNIGIRKSNLSKKEIDLFINIFNEKINGDKILFIGY